MAGDAVREQPDRLERGDDEAAERAAPAATALERRRDRGAFLGDLAEGPRWIHAGLSPQIHHAVAHGAAAARVDQLARGLEREVLDARAVLFRDRRDDGRQVLDPVAGMARLVTGHVGEQLFQQRLLGLVPHVAEAVQSQSFRHHLHADRFEAPVVGRQHIVQQGLQRRGDGLHVAEFADVGRKHLDVSSLVERLRGRVELGVHVRNRVHQLRRHHQRGLLAVEEVRQHEGSAAARDLPARLGGEVLPELGLLDRHPAQRKGARERVAIDLLVPVELFERDPLAVERVGVERAQLVDLRLVVPVVERLEGGLDAGDRSGMAVGECVRHDPSLPGGQSASKVGIGDAPGVRA